MAAAQQASVCVLGIDFTSAPTRRKPIAVAVCRLNGPPARLAWAAPGQPAAAPPAPHAARPPSAASAAAAAAAAPLVAAASPGGERPAGLPASPSPGPLRLSVERVERFTSLTVLADWLLGQPGPLVAAADLPFGQPREAAEALGWTRPRPDAQPPHGASSPKPPPAASSDAATDGHVPEAAGSPSACSEWRCLLGHVAALTCPASPAAASPAAASPAAAKPAPGRGSRFGGFEAALRAFMDHQPPGRKHLRRAVAAYTKEVGKGGRRARRGLGGRGGGRGCEGAGATRRGSACACPSAPH
jgi:hypothetical protein